jgi:O-antigen/teichoic acid export membrane protein
VVDVLVMAPSLFLVVAFPVLVQLHGTDPARYRRACQQANDALIGVGCALSLVTVLAAGPLIRLLGGDGYLGAVTPLRILALAGLAGFANSLFGQLMIVEGLQATILKVSGIALAINVGLSLVLVHTNHLVGGATAAAISEVGGAVLVIGIVSSRARLGLSWTRSAVVVGGAGALAAAGIGLEHLGVSAVATTAVGLMLFVVGWLQMPGHPARALLQGRPGKV